MKKKYFIYSILILVLSLLLFGCNGGDDSGSGDDGSGDGDVSLLIYYRDSDGDGFGNPDVSVKDTSRPSGYVANSDDCDDSDGSVYESCIKTTYYYDGDRDGHGDINVSRKAYISPIGYVLLGDDCNDSDKNTNPDAGELCDGVDNNCDGSIDEGCAKTTYYLDSDSDGYGAVGSSVEAYNRPTGYVLNSNDCDDSNSSINPGSVELCDGVDNNCSGEVDEGCVKTTYYLDADGDGFGDLSSSVEGYTLPLGYVANSDDCDDSDGNINPYSEEVCDNVDNNCDGVVDEGCVLVTYHLDADGDGFGDGDVSVEDYEQPSGYVVNSDDCDDSDDNINPDSEEICDNVDNDCDGEIDEGFNDLCQYVFKVIAVEDTYASEESPDANHGGGTLHTGEQDNYNNLANQVSFVKFDISDIPDNAIIVEAKFYMVGVNYDISPIGHTWVRQISEHDWDEYELTYNNMPTGYSQSVVKAIDDYNEKRIDWDVTSFVESWLGGAANFGMMIDTKSDGLELSCIFYGREYFNNYTISPVLEIVYEMPEGFSPDDLMSNPLVNDAMEASEFVFHLGDDAPNVEGTWDLDEIIVDSSFLDFVGASMFSTIRLSDQVGDDIRMEESLDDGATWVEYDETHITGEGDSFTVWGEVTERVSFDGYCVFDEVKIITGTKLEDGDVETSTLYVTLSSVCDGYYSMLEWGRMEGFLYPW